MLLLRPATLGDIPLLARIHTKARATAMPWLPELHTIQETEGWLAGQLGRLVVAEAQGAPAAYASVASGWLHSLYVAPQHQGRGLGSALLDHAKGREPDGLRLYGFQGNEIARRFYEDRGFTLEATTDGAGCEERVPDVLYRWRPGLLIRPARASDSSEAVRVVRACFDEYGFSWDADDYCADLYDLEAHYLSAGHRFWVAEREGTVVGTAAFVAHTPIVGPSAIVEVDGVRRIGGSDCSVERMYVHPEARRLGVGRALIGTVLAEARRQGRRTMEIWSDKKLARAHALYASYGAVVCGDRLCHDPDQSPEWGMRLPVR